MSNKRWQDMATLIAGIWFAISPWVFSQGEGDSRIVYNALAVGGALVLFSAGALARPETWEEVIDFLIGIWTVISPWALGYTAMRALTVNAVVVGVIVAVLAAGTAMERGHFVERWRHRGHA